MRYKIFSQSLTCVVASAAVVVVFLTSGCTMKRQLAFREIEGLQTVQNENTVEIQDIKFEIQAGKYDKFPYANTILKKRLVEQLYARKMTPISSSSGRYALRGYLTVTEKRTVNGWFVPSILFAALGSAAWLDLSTDYSYYDEYGYHPAPSPYLMLDLCLLPLYYVATALPANTYRHWVTAEVGLIDNGSGREIMHNKYIDSSKKWCNLYQQGKGAKRKSNRAITDIVDLVLEKITNDAAKTVADSIRAMSTEQVTAPPPALPVAAPTADAWGVVPGKSVEITLKNGSKFRGTVVAVDERLITLEVTPGSRLDFYKVNIADVRDLSLP